MNLTGLPALSTDRLVAGYRLRRRPCPILSGLDIEVRAGELACLLGPNGVGKSTLLRTLCGIQPAIDGFIRVEGTDIRRLSPMDLAKKIGVVLTERVMVGALSGRQVVELGRYSHVGWSGRLLPKDAEAVDWALSAAGARHLAERDMNRMSDGERQRVMIARALAQKPSVLLLDEPTAYLDVASRVELFGLLRVLAREERLAVLVSTHDLETALRMADSILLLAQGGRLHSGAPEDVVLEGCIAGSFETGSIAFDAEERMFRPLTRAQGNATVAGTGLAAALARSVLEREGYTVGRPGGNEIEVAIQSDRRWTAIQGGESHGGQTFGELAAWLRGLSGNANGSGKRFTRGA